MPVQTELNLRLPNSPGALAQLCELLATQHVGVLAIDLEASGQLRLIVDNTTRAMGVLTEEHHRVSERQVLTTFVRDSVRDIAAVLRLAADAGVNIEYVYSGISPNDGHVELIIGTADAMRAATVSGL
jgi:hypothetical protein